MMPMVKTIVVLFLVFAIAQGVKILSIIIRSIGAIRLRGISVECHVIFFGVLGAILQLQLRLQLRK